MCHTYLIVHEINSFQKLDCASYDATYVSNLRDRVCDTIVKKLDCASSHAVPCAWRHALAARVFIVVEPSNFVLMRDE